MSINKDYLRSVSRCFAWLLPVVLLLLAVACRSDVNNGEVDRLNDISYSYHYRNLDTTRVYAMRALRLASGYPDGMAEAKNNLAFVYLAKMKYGKAASLLEEILHDTDNHIELLVANVQLMRLCQRRSDNKNFYHYRQQAVTSLKRLHEDENLLSTRQMRRLEYARSEYSIVMSAYFYYVGQRLKSSEAIQKIDPSGPIVKDTAQLLAYYYNVGAGGVLSASSHIELMQSEFDYLMRCYLLSRQYHYIFWEANSMQAISEHLQSRKDRQNLKDANMQEFDYLNIDHMPDSLLSGNLAQRALALFDEYGDVYQMAGAWRTLSEAYRSIGDYESALVCLDNALTKDTAVNAAPDLVASIREQLSIVYSAMDDKPQSDYNRNIYLDLQERTRQDRFLEARAEQLGSSLQQLDMMIVAVMLLIVVVVGMLVYFGYWRMKHSRTLSLEQMREPFENWKRLRDSRNEDQNEKIEEKKENLSIGRRTLERYRERNIEQRAKVWLASTVTPLISRMVHEIRCLSSHGDSASVRAERFEYISQLADSIGQCNRCLTSWIQLRQGDFKLRIESFPLQSLFYTLGKNAMNFKMNGVNLEVEPTGAVVKADRTLTLFMLNTMAENARKFTGDGGKVVVAAAVADNYVEVSVTDNGCGMTDEQAKNIFSHNVVDSSSDADARGSHGFGLVNCRGIIDKYRKMSSIFSVCAIGVESEQGRGSRFYFRLPKGVRRVLAVIGLIILLVPNAAMAVNQRSEAQFNRYWTKARAYADSTYFCNIRGTYVEAMSYADSCLQSINAALDVLPSNRGHSSGRLRLTGDYPAKAAELRWFRDSVAIDFGVLLDVRNEAAVAALALHQWSVYSYNNAVYTALYRECSADNTIASYVREMQRAENNRNVAIVMLVLLLLAIFPTYYLVYYRHVIFFRRYVNSVGLVNQVLGRTELSSEEKLARIENIRMSSEAVLKQLDHSRMSGGNSMALQSLVEEICGDLLADIARSRELGEKTCLLDDECQRVAFDCDRLYVSNNVLDNCLSSLKHETMYYPSRLKQLVENGDNPANIEALGEVAQYYLLLYTTLIAQAVNILQGAGALAGFSIDYLKSILKKKNHGKDIKPSLTNESDGYVLLDFVLENPDLVADVGSTPSVLFTASTPDVDFLVCCQIMRDMGECTGARGCGIKARVVDDRHLLVRVKASRLILRNKPCSEQ